jgi:hypothetical protein
MDALTQLSSFVNDGLAFGRRELTRSEAIDQVLRALQVRATTARTDDVRPDLLREAVRTFWDSLKVDSLRDGRLVSFGLCLPLSEKGPCLLEDTMRFSALLDGIDHWLSEPRRYRRCYHGLVTNYFSYDGLASDGSETGKANWTRLRGYLGDRSERISTSGVNPDWVSCVLEHPQLFSDLPCSPFAADLLRGDTAKVEDLCSKLGIGGASWFMRELVLAQIAMASERVDSEFAHLVLQLLALLAPRPVLRDRGLILLLDRYARIATPLLDADLRDCAVTWWGNPWLTSNKMRWGGVTPAAREMVAGWLKLEFIRSFFTLLAEGGSGDRRRLEFWTRYVDSIDDIHFALGADATNSRSREFVELQAKMKGRVVSLKDSVAANNAFVMTMGDLVVVEFSGQANALYGYDRREGLPFDLARPVLSAKDSSNSLKNSRRKLWLKHADNIHGWEKWEHMFAATLRKHFHIEPGAAERLSSVGRSRSPAVAERRESAAPGRDAGVVGAGWAGASYSRTALDLFAQVYGLTIEDNTSRGGSLWVRSGRWEATIDRQLSSWGFKFKPQKGWWK